MMMVPSQNGMTALMIASYNTNGDNYVKVVKVLGAETGIDIYAKDNVGGGYGSYN